MRYSGTDSPILSIEHYDNGHMYAKGSMEVRFSKISGYEYECGPFTDLLGRQLENAIYAFNTDKVI